MSDGNSYEVEALSLAAAAALMRLGEDSLRELILMGELPALSLNRKHLVLLREDVLEFMRAHARLQQSQRRAAWEATRTDAEFRGVGYVARKPGRKRHALPTLLDPPIDGREALGNAGKMYSRKRTRLPLTES